MEYPNLRTLVVFFCLLMIILFVITGCANEYDLCVEREKQEYRQRNPNATYGQIVNRQQEFELLCSRLKKN